MPYYTGIGSRSTPTTVLRDMERLAQHLAARGWRLRSGAADGADQAFGRGAGARADIFKPWARFGVSERGAAVHILADDYLLNETLMAHLELGCPHHGRLSQGAHKLHARNVHQVIGERLDHPSDFVVCWTPNAEVTGGTATAIRIAQLLGVPVFNLAALGCEHELLMYLMDREAAMPRRPRATT